MIIFIAQDKLLLFKAQTMFIDIRSFTYNELKINCESTSQ